MLCRLLLSFLLLKLVCSNALISLDLGSEFMKIGIVKPGVPIDIVLNTETKRKTPMTVYIKGDERLFGDSAVTRGEKSPKNAYSNLLDILGKTVDNPVVQEYKERFPYHTIEADPVRNTVVFRHDESTFYSVEELLAMQIEFAVQLATKHGEAPVKKAIICVPPFFHQREREAMLNVAEIAGVQVMQLMTTTSAIALQYAVFRNIKMTEKPMIVLFATVGSQFTTAAVVSYSQVKDKVTKEQVPTVQVMGVGYDRGLGSYEMDIRLREHLADKFTEKYPKLPDIRKNGRAMKKLQKEARKVKTVLSANQDTYAQVESLHQDKDFRVKVTREEMENLFADLFPRFQAPFVDAINSAGISKPEIEQVVLFGGGTRIPKIQEQILKATDQKELHKYINTDEAAAMGSAFMAASSSSVFRTKQIKLRDANQFPFFVSFNKLVLNEEGAVTEEKLVNKELYYRNNGIPQKKAMTYTKFTDDFHFNVSYGNLEHLSERQASEFATLPLMMVNVKGVKDVFNQHHDKTSKGIKAHIMVDDSGLIGVESVEAIFETIVANKTETGWMESVSNFFTGNSDDEGEKKEEKKEEAKEGEKKEEEKKEEKKADGEKAAEEKKEEIKKDAKNETEAKNEAAPEKPVIVKEVLKVETVHFGIPRVSDTSVSKEKLAALKKIDDDKRATEQARNNLESFVINMKDTLEADDTYKAASTPEEMEKMKEALSAETDWLEEDSWGETYVVFNARLAKIEDYCDPVLNRVKEMKARPAAIAELKNTFNMTVQFLAKIANTTEELRYHTATELENLEKLLNTTRDWLDKTAKEQEGLAKNVDPVLKLEAMQTKNKALERELYYLVRKPIPQWYKDKLNKMMEALKNSTVKAEEAKKSESTEEGKKDEEKTDDAKTEEKGEGTKEGEKSDKEGKEAKEEKSAEEKVETKEEKSAEGEKPEETPVETPKEEKTEDKPKEETKEEKPLQVDDKANSEKETKEEL
ncbi:hypothetical protein ACHWQZ_G001228 [Mnemiopsis leidyi]